MPDPLARLLEGKSVPVRFDLDACMARPPCRRVTHEALAESLLREFIRELRHWSTPGLRRALDGSRTPLCWSAPIGRLTLLCGQWETERVARGLAERELVRRRSLAGWDVFSLLEGAA